MRKTDRTQKPFGPFEDHADCVANFEDDPDVDDPDELCAEMERNPDEFFGSFDSADSMLQNLKVTFVSGVDVPAQDSMFVMAKHAEGYYDLDPSAMLNKAEAEADWRRKERPLVVLKQEDDEEDEDEPTEQKTWAPVLIPDEVDKQGDIVPKKEIERAAHEFLKNHGNIDTDHNLLSGKGEPIESWTLKEDKTFTLPDGSESREFPKGTWMLGIEWSDEAWKRIESGELTGLSIFGEAEALDIDQLADAVAGEGGMDPQMASVELGKDGPLTTCEWRALVGSRVKPTAKGGSSPVKQIDDATHEAVSAVVSEYLDTLGEDETAFIGGLQEWASGSDSDQADLLLEVLSEFREDTGAPEDALVDEFAAWMADQLEDTQTEETEASIERRAVAASASQFQKSVSGQRQNELRQIAEKAQKLDRTTNDLI